ncbi:hypothetical protein SAMN04488109_0771 [Chryseolinea serpens]|uniref:Uncharacterized protein n=1 Tax=Chryseolinea serpens TaxID=947013 RepID=A0A1M5KPM0_9BACT|nr:hypothetical protein [Chryseolinea serpens]SHG54802.1 hypothetical protein SAMN04488109_0771 [Chryseolinea serpens]
MRSTPFVLIISVILFCGFSSARRQIQQIDPISESVALLKKYIADSKNEMVSVRIINQHNGTYTIASTLWVGTDSIRVLSYIIDMTDGKSDKILNFSKQVFLWQLDRASHPMNSPVYGGHHQTISIQKGEQEAVFRTLYGRALMDLLEDGK